MKATFEVTIRIDGRHVDTAFGMHNGAEDISLDSVQGVSTTVTRLREELLVELQKRQKKVHFRCFIS
jgi:hypothetical protein